MKKLTLELRVSRMCETEVATSVHVVVERPQPRSKLSFAAVRVNRW